MVAWVIADDARDETRRSFISQAELCFRARLKAATVREKLAMLAARGYEFRVIHGYGKDGRPVYAAKGHAVDYVVPDLLKGTGLPAPKPALKGAGPPAAYSDPKALEMAPKALEITPKGAGLPAPPSLNPLSNPSPGGTGELSTDGRTSPRSRARGTRLPGDWLPTRELVQWARIEFPAVDSKYETDKFLDYWHSKAGAGATKVDWQKTWKNWIRKASEHTAARSAPRSRREAEQAATDALFERNAARDNSMHLRPIGELT